MSTYSAPSGRSSFASAGVSAHLRRMPMWRTWLLPFAALAIGSAACGSILGDFPDGRVSDNGSDAAVPPTADGASGPDGPPLPAGAPRGAICLVPNGGVVLDMAVDATAVFWLRGPPSGTEGYAVESCPKRGTKIQTIATLQGPPESLALSDKHVFWSVGEGPASARGVWRSDKRASSTPPTLFFDASDPGPITIANGAIYAGTHGGRVLIQALEGVGSGLWINLGNFKSIAASGENLYWSRGETSEVWTKPHGTAQSSAITGPFSLPPSFLAYDGRLYWAAPSPTGITIHAQGGDGGATAIVTQLGFVSFAVRSGGIYWTANDDATGSVRKCAADAPCANPEPLWRENVEVSRIALDDASVFFAAKRNEGTYIVRAAR
ncbi:hypothetical protein [Pendulispora albinea]|uniref:Uncharacterized protein n=1 Tax=Pendulispora albinea TaxID=2741071 RepID=A0ABZ2MBX7_9BACT